MARLSFPRVMPHNSTMRKGILREPKNLYNFRARIKLDIFKIHGAKVIRIFYLLFFYLDHKIAFSQLDQQQGGPNEGTFLLWAAWHVSEVLECTSKHFRSVHSQVHHWWEYPSTAYDASHSNKMYVRKAIM